jgi:hypothetical protein
MIPKLVNYKNYEKSKRLNDRCLGLHVIIIGHIEFGKVDAINEEGVITGYNKVWKQYQVKTKNAFYYTVSRENMIPNRKKRIDKILSI